MSLKNTIEVSFSDGEVHFPKGYFFKQSAIHKLKKIPVDAIDEVVISTHPPSLIYQAKEVVFIPSEAKEELLAFAKHHQLPIKERFDIWEHLCLPYLDTEFPPEQLVSAVQQLTENGVSELEQIEIHKKMKRVMARNAFVWEWVYLGLFDYLSWARQTQRNYLWAMEIALRNFEK